MSHAQKIASSRRTMRLDRVSAKDLLAHDVRFSCEDCSHFAPNAKICTLGLPAASYLRETQRKTHEITGHMALCRFLEID